MSNPILERAARAALTACNESAAYADMDGDLSGVTVDGLVDMRRVASAVLMAVLSGVKRVHTDGYNWREGGNGPFVIYDDLEAILADGGE